MSTVANLTILDRNIRIRRDLEILRSQLENERNSFMSQWRDLNDYILPRRGRFFVSDTNRGERRNLKIIDSTATLAARTLRAGMMSGVTSPARPWFRLSTSDQELAEVGAVKLWLDEVGKRMRTVFLKSNLYNVLPILYGDIGTFGTSAMFMEEDFNSVVRFHPFPIGSYTISNNEKLQVDMFQREFRMTVRQIVESFGRRPNNSIDWTNISTHVRNQWENGNWETWADIIHTVIPNEDYDPNKKGARFKKYKSVYYELGTTGGVNAAASLGSTGAQGENKILRESGFDYFPVLAPRWEVTGEDTYATSCPGMIAIGDIKQLQVGEKRSLQAIDKMVNPPMVGPTSLRNNKVSTLPGDITYVDVREGMQGFRSAFQIQYDLNAMEQKQQQVRQRISRSFYEDLFLMLAQSDRRQITAREIEERHEEKLLALGPVLEQLNQDLLDPLIDNTFDIMVRQNLIPEPPEEVRGKDLKVEYISIMAQAQKLAGIGAVERFVGFASQVGAVDPQVLDKVNTDEVIDVYGDITSIPPEILRSDEDVQAIRSNRAQQQQAQQQAAMIQQAASTAKELAGADLEGQNALSAITGGGI